MWHRNIDLDAGIEHLRKLGEKHGLKNAPDLLAKVQEAVARWRDYAKQANVSVESAKGIASKIGA